ncbi:transporter substrate-binding domain-containing protein [Methylobacterium sp. V23]|jgi:polar amino acid transport system substrate-binding protein|uniref:transporter substrate-binding domain-containing protein n=1 Tax=Methylobacterium sp. V23 TaxID=2044878 RepID=UPI000CDA5177|nr:transporter substrate-binding domain-containing protein [Methylobacterium sp. V23]POR41126.1 amino acid ABC transporter substrate-binding protein [Methylobacterium sp. V23]
MPLTKRRLLVALGLGAALLSAAGAQAQDALAEITRTKVVKIGIPTDYPPYGFVGLDLQPMGLDVDMANLIGAKLGAKVELVPVVSANRIPYLQTKKIDLIVSTLGKNEERMKIIDFSAAYAPFYQGVFALKSTSIKSFDDLAGKSVAVTRGAMEDEMLGKVAPASAQIQRFEDQAATTAAFAAGQTQVIATSVSNIGVLSRKNPSLGVEYKLLLRDSPCFVGIAKGEDALLAKVNAIVLAAKADGTLEALSQKWLKRGTGDLPL